MSLTTCPSDPALKDYLLESFKRNEKDQIVWLTISNLWKSTLY